MVYFILLSSGERLALFSMKACRSRSITTTSAASAPAVLRGVPALSGR
jgi:hypothetical protein